jgi:sugar-phosphatase
VKQQVECEALVFDLDGVLVDSTACIQRHWRLWAGGQGLDVEEVLRACHGRRTVETIRLVAPHLDAELEAAQFDAREASESEGIVAMAGAVELLGSLPPERWAVATSGTRATATSRMGRAGLPVPNVLVNADDVRRGKPDPEAFLLAAEWLGAVPAGCVVVEDSPAGVEAAHAAGMRVIGFASSSNHGLGKADMIIFRLGDLRLRQASAGLVLEVNSES